MPIIKIILIATIIILGFINLHDIQRSNDLDEVRIEHTNE